MLNHFSITSSNLDVSTRFYDAITRALGIANIRYTPDQIRYGELPSAADPNASYFSVKLARIVSNDERRHWCFAADSRVAVDKFWAAGIAAGGTDLGKPGLRLKYSPTYYAAFLIDPDGNRLEAVCHKAA